MLYSKKSLNANFWHFCRGLFWSYLRDPACAGSTIISYIVEMTPIENKSHHFLSLFVGVLSDRFCEKQPVQDQR